ncbi:hypothetical protein GDO81_018001 [Engystomops pustulosus]|uniref:Essential MCU regulator, mitochondrial n=1 Tax=Engystomops pustulosus TaxID=76066 RepID=A0AAV7A8P0_ENGPU|nr:hypothetical protein GDO81_018001 [Engystomops pustulosus]KAG8556274.1 hypothetical protein GDO81_018001 [Engystomops pustulosus]
MANAGLATRIVARTRRFLTLAQFKPSVPTRTAISTNTGAIYPNPEKVSFGLLRVFSVVIPFLYVGTLISKNFAALLEEHDIFVPEDDDDDD